MPNFVFYGPNAFPTTGACDLSCCMWKWTTHLFPCILLASLRASFMNVTEAFLLLTFLNKEHSFNLCTMCFAHTNVLRQLLLNPSGVASSILARVFSRFLLLSKKIYAHTTCLHLSFVSKLTDNLSTSFFGLVRRRFLSTVVCVTNFLGKWRGYHWTETRGHRTSRGCPNSGHHWREQRKQYGEDLLQTGQSIVLLCRCRSLPTPMHLITVMPF